MKLEFNDINEFKEFVGLLYMGNAQKNVETTETQIKNERWLIKNDLAGILAGIVEGMIKITEHNKNIAGEIKQLQNTPDKPVDIKVEIPKKLKRHYPPSYKKQLPKIRKLTKKGTFLLGKGKVVKWDINTILQLKKCVDSDLTNGEIAKKIGLAPDTTGRLLFMIETGKFDKYLSQWEQMQADQIFKNRKVPVENNPQKRRENLQGVI